MLNQQYQWGIMPATKEEIYAAKTLEQLQTLERKYSYKFGWANKIHAARSKPRARIRKSNREPSRPLGKEISYKDAKEGNGRIARPLVLSSKRVFTNN